MNVMTMLIMMAERMKRTIALLFLIRIKLTLMELVMHVTMIAMEMASRTMRMFVPAIVMRPNLHLGT